MRILKIIWLYGSVGFQTLYYITRYGLRGAERKLDEEMKEQRQELEQLLEGLRLGEER